MNAKSAESSDRNERLRSIDVPLTVATALMLAFGVVMVYSASSYSAEVNYGNEYFFMTKQIVGCVGGAASMTLFTLLDYRKLKKARWFILGVGVLLLALVLIPGVGVENYGARRWLNLGVTTLQSSEVAKVCFVVFAAAYMSDRQEKMTTVRGWLPLTAVGLGMCVLIMLEPSMSVTICLALVMLTMLVMGGMRLLHMLFVLLPLVAAAVVLVLVEPYRLSRLFAFLDPWSSPLGEGYQLLQSYYALGSGGLFGVGLFNSRQKYLYLPFAESDFIFSVIGEELGLIGCAAVMAGYCFIVFRLISIARRAADRFGCYIAGGMAALVGIQVLINIAVVSGCIPPTGIPLPLISSGSSALVVFCGGIGICQSVRLRSHASVRAIV